MMLTLHSFSPHSCCTTDLLTAEHSCLVGALHRNRTLGETVLQILQLSRISTTEEQGCFIIRWEKHQHFDYSAIIIPCLRVAMPPVKAVLNIASPTWRRSTWWGCLRLLLSLTWKQRAVETQIFAGGFAAEVHPFFCFCSWNCDQMGPTASAKSSAGQ